MFLLTQQPLKKDSLVLLVATVLLFSKKVFLCSINRTTARESFIKALKGTSCENGFFTGKRNRGQ